MRGRRWQLLLLKETFWCVCTALISVILITNVCRRVHVKCIYTVFCRSLLLCDLVTIWKKIEIKLMCKSTKYMYQNGGKNAYLHVQTYREAINAIDTCNLLPFHIYTHCTVLLRDKSSLKTQLD